MITSTSNGQIKKIQQLLKKSKVRREEGLFIAEGLKRYIFLVLLPKKEPGRRYFERKDWRKKREKS